MIIPLDDHQRIKSTEYSWNLEVLHKPKAKEAYWKPIKYYATFSQALREACAREIRLDGAESLAEAFAAATRLSEKYSKVFDGYEAVGNE